MSFSCVSNSESNHESSIVLVTLVSTISNNGCFMSKVESVETNKISSSVYFSSNEHSNSSSVFKYASLFVYDSIGLT